MYLLVFTLRSACDRMLPMRILAGLTSILCNAFDRFLTLRTASDNILIRRIAYGEILTMRFAYGRSLTMRTSFGRLLTLRVAVYPCFSGYCLRPPFSEFCLIWLIFDPAYCLICLFINYVLLMNGSYCYFS